MNVYETQRRALEQNVNNANVLVIRVLTIVYNTRNQWRSELRPL
jgi:hypothetical protein